jgi:ribosomal protein L35
MPFTPLTPVTPHLVTKKERKDRRRAEGRRVVHERDMVQSPKEIFGDAW